MLQSLGFDVAFDVDLLKNGAKGPFKTSVGGFSSFRLEVIVAVMLTITLVLFWRQSARLARLRETYASRFEKLIRLESPDELSADIGTIGRAARD